MTSTELATTEQPQPWHRQPGETAQSYHAFNVYRNLPHPRTVTGAARLHIETVKNRTFSTVNTQWQTWSRKHNWPERADAFDAYLDRLRVEARETERARIDREQMQEGRFLRQSAMTRLIGGNDHHGIPVEGIDWNDIDPSEALAFYRVGVTTERQAAGLAIGQTLGMIPLSQARQILEEVFEAAMDFIPEERRQAYVQRVQSIADGR